MNRFLKLTILSIAAVPVITSCEKEDPYEISMSILSNGVDTIQGIDGRKYEVVDLGLGTLWAKCNLGADSPEQPGFYLSWGETATKETYTEKNYAWYNARGNKITKYCNIKDQGEDKYVDSLYTLQPQDDAVKVLIGNGFHIPTEAEYSMLRTWCSIRWCKLNGKGGFLLTSTKKGYENNSIFIPMAGRMDYDEIFHNGSYGFYWTNALDLSNPKNAHVMIFKHLENATDMDKNITHERYLGMNIRPVFRKQ